MEAKGCAKPAVWKNARRHFYWAVRARVAHSVAIAQLEEVAPDSTFDYRSRLLDSLAAIDLTTEYRQMADAIEKLDLSPTLAQLNADHLLRQMIELTKDDRKAAMDSFMRLADTFSDEERAAMAAVLQSGARTSGK
jgi:acetyl-CoA carboxylase / biotin carboxylase 1